MKKIYCDICGKEMRRAFLPSEKFKDIFNISEEETIEDMCEECFMTIYCCVRMMKKTKWKPDFHEVTKSDNIWTRDLAGYELSDLRDKTGLQF